MARTPRWLINIHHFFKYSYWTLDSSYRWEHIFLLIIQKHGKNLSLHFVSQICIFCTRNEKSFDKILVEGSIWYQLNEYISPALFFCFKSLFLCMLITRVLCFSWKQAQSPFSATISVGKGESKWFVLLSLYTYQYLISLISLLYCYSLQ